MASNNTLELQQKLFKRMGLEPPVQKSTGKTQQWQKGSRQTSRKELRRAGRVEKKQRIYTKRDNVRTQLPATADRRLSHEPTSPPGHIPPRSESQQPKQISRVPGLLSGANRVRGGIGDDSGIGENGIGSGESAEDMGSPTSDAAVEFKQDVRVSKRTRDMLAQDDAEVEEFERKLGIKKGRKSLPKSFADDGLDELLVDVEDDQETNVDLEERRKQDYDEWLSAKRGETTNYSKTPTALGSNARSRVSQNKEDLELTDSSMDMFGSDSGSDDAVSASEDLDDFEGFGSDPEENEIAPARVRENPYIAPFTGNQVAKYVPPSKRKDHGSETESTSRLRRQIQGLVNRLTDANILTIVQSTEALYQNNARGEVNELICETILTQVNKGDGLTNQFFVLVGGYAAAIFKVVGTSFGSHLVNKLVEEFSREYASVQKTAGKQAAIAKEPSNLLTLICQLYTFEVLTCRLIFDYMERFLADLSELNVELLLRVCRTTGRSLRRDDPATLKHVTSVLSKAVAKPDQDQISVRTKFMIETLRDLRDGKTKAKGLDSTVVSEHSLRMRKQLGGLKSQSRRLDGLKPMGMSLGDVEGADTMGKWWLVGASVPVRDDASHPVSGRQRQELNDDEADFTDHEDIDFVLPNYSKLAHAQGFGTSIQISIFTALMSAASHKQAYRQFIDLNLKKDDQLELARVLVQCVGSETRYNGFYALVGKDGCSDGRIRFALQDRLWKIFRGMGEALFGDEPEDDDTADAERMKDQRRLKNVSRFYAGLIVDGALGLVILKPLDLPKVNDRVGVFVELLVIELLQQITKLQDKRDSVLAKVFGPTKGFTVLAAGLHWFLGKRVRKSKLVKPRTLQKLETTRQMAQVIVKPMET